jgi:hypothetical protein
MQLKYALLHQSPMHATSKRKGEGFEFPI